MTILSSCSVTYVRDYKEQIELIKTNFPEIYDLYCNGDIIITSVYTYKKDGSKRVHVDYRYR